MENEVITASCDICGSDSNFDEESLKASTHQINGCDVLICCPCEDDLFRTLLKYRISEERMKDIASNLMSDEREDLLELYREEDNNE